MDKSPRVQSDFDLTWLQLWASRTIDYAVIALAPDGAVRSWNPGAERIHEFLVAEIAGRPFSIVFTQEDVDRGALEKALGIARSDGRYDTEMWQVRKNGSTFWASMVVTALHKPDGQLAGFGVIVRDISDKRHAHEAVVESERRFRLLVRGVTDYAIFMLSPDGYITNWNLGAERIKGYTSAQAIGMHFSRFYTDEDAAAGVPQRGLDTAARRGKFETEGWRVRADGSRFWAHVVIDAIRDDEGNLVGFAKITRDVTEQRHAAELLQQTQAALFQAQKMEAIGKLTGGVAHDFNNVLQVLRGNLELLETRYGRDSWGRERLDRAIEAVDRGAKLASQLLAFGRRQALQPIVVNLAKTLRRMDDLLRHALGETIEVETVVTGGLWNTSVDVHQLENVILNLAINARDAMPDGGKLTVELANAMLDDQYVAPLGDVPAGQYVMLGLTDTGTGMSSEVMDHAFEPFFTTKPEGEGTGLGLSMAYGFVKQSGGHIKVYSEVGHGTTLKLYLPRSMDAPAELHERRPARLAGGNETILVVEDDQRVQATVVEMLTHLGYAVLKANDARSALSVIESGVQIDLLFTDVVMPGPLRSADMAQKAVKILPDMKVLFTSGYTQNAIVHGGRLDPGVELLSKPYSREQLAQKIRSMLGVSNDAPDVADTRPMVSTLDVKAGEASKPEHRYRLLLVDDDSAAREATCEILSTLGHVVVQAASAEDALQAFADERFDAVLTDITLPGMSGIELASKLAEMRYEGAIVFVSGCEPPVISDTRYIHESLPKPYAIEQLQQVIDRVCQAAAESAGRP